MGTFFPGGGGAGATTRDMSPEELLGEVAKGLEGAGIPYMITGSFASSMLGLPRSTRDLDVVVGPEESQLDDLVGAFPEDAWYFDGVAVRDAFERRSMCNAVHLDSGWRGDVVFRKDRLWSLEESARRAPLDVRGVPVMFLRAEDSILSKLDWIRQGGSSRQMEDAGNVVDMQGAALDLGVHGALGKGDRCVGIAGATSRRCCADGVRGTQGRRSPAVRFGTTGLRWDFLGWLRWFAFDKLRLNPRPLASEARPAER